jgi:hypothetical protein
MVSMEVHLEFLPSYGIYVAVCCSEGIPPIGQGTFKSSRSVQDLLSVIALGDVEFLFDNLKPVIGIQGVNRMRESRRVVVHKISVLVSSLWCILLLMLVLLVLLILLNLLYRSSESLQNRHLRCDELLHVGIWWRSWQLLINTLVLVVPGT